MESQQSNVIKMTVPEEELERVRKEIEKLDKKRIKLGLEGQFIYQESDIYEKQIESGDYKGYVPVRDVIVSLDRVKFNGWVLLGTIAEEIVTVMKDGKEENKVVAIASLVPGAEEIIGYEQLKRWKNSKFVCDHCSTNKKRNKVIIVANQEAIDNPDEGQVLRVGSTCVKNYLGHHSPAQLLQWFIDFENTTKQYVEIDFDNQYGREPRMYNVEDVVTMTLMNLNKYPYISNKKATEGGGISTSASVDMDLKDYYNALIQRKTTSESREFIDFATLNIEVVKSILETAKKLTVNNDYQETVKICATSFSISPKFVSYLVSYTATWFITQQQEKNKATTEKKQETPENNTYFGEVNKMYDLPLMLIGVRSFTSNFGQVYIHTFVNQEGQTFVWWSNGQDWSNDFGSDYIELRFKVKEHKEYKGVCQTVISYVKKAKTEKKQSQQQKQNINLTPEPTPEPTIEQEVKRTTKTITQIILDSFDQPRPGEKPFKHIWTTRKKH